MSNLFRELLLPSPHDKKKHENVEKGGKIPRPSSCRKIFLVFVVSSVVALAEPLPAEPNAYKGCPGSAASMAAFAVFMALIDLGIFYRKYLPACTSRVAINLGYLPEIPSGVHQVRQERGVMCVSSHLVR